MSCFLCGHETTGSHHLNCPRIAHPDMEPWRAIELGLLPRPEAEEVPREYVEVLKEGSMTTVPVDNSCEHGSCDNPKYSDHPRVKFCEDHRDPKNRKE